MNKGAKRDGLFLSKTTRMTTTRQLLLLSLLWVLLRDSHAFSKAHLHLLHRAPSSSSSLASSAPSEVENNDNVLECALVDSRIDLLKAQLLQLAASYDRGYGAGPSARESVGRLIEALEASNTATNAAAGIDGQSPSPLWGNWRMIWTTAADVLGLQASPIFGVGAIYQVFEPPTVTNIIDFWPRVQALLPVGVADSLIRAKVQTAASPRRNQGNRIGLDFESVELRPVRVAGMNVDVFPPLQLPLPKLPASLRGSSESSPGYFDVTYLDGDMLIIRQNAPGGLFCLLRVDSIRA